MASKLPGIQYLNGSWEKTWQLFHPAIFDAVQRDLSKAEIGKIRLLGVD